MTKDEALDLALEALKPFSTPNWAGTGVDKANAAITAIRQAQTQTAQEPVANAAFSETIRRLREDHHTWRDSIDRCLEAAELLEKHLAPAAQREWVGLTEQEAAECWSTIAVRTWQAIEDKLKEKNNGGSQPRESP
jgi:hypothetical protein